MAAKYTEQFQILYCETQDCCYSPEICARCVASWNAAIKLVEENGSSHNTQIMPVCPKCGSGVTVFQGDIIHRCNNDGCQWAGKPA